MSTIAAISSPIGAGGIGIVRVSGEDALAIADAVFIFAHKNARKSGDSSCENLQDRIDEKKENGLREEWKPLYMNFGTFDAGEF